jgi:hypothetical protein
MERREVAAIIGAYSRQGLSAVRVAGGFVVDSESCHEYRTTREARRDTQTDPRVLRVMVGRQRVALMA